MPSMDGLTAIENILAIENPRPVAIVLSAFTRETSRANYESFTYGAWSHCKAGQRFGPLLWIAEPGNCASA